nr:ketoacyl-ACP synthase III [Eubacterium sp.]
MAVKIIGTGSYLPKNVADNHFLSTIVDTNDEWISQRTGIKERRLSSGSKEGTSFMAVEAAKAALENAGVTAEELDLIIVATVSADSFVPSTSCYVQGEIGAIRATCFDLNAACSGFLFSMNTANAYLEMGMAKTALIIGAETLSREVDWSDRSTCILFGDGAGAAILRKEEGEGGILASVTGSDGSQGDVLTCKSRGIQNPFYKSKRKKDYIQMEGQAVFRFAVTTVPKYIKHLLKKTGLEADDIKYYVLHQANRRILESIAKRLKVDMDKIPMNLDHYGNTSSASIPILLDEINRNELLEPGDKIILSGFGGGLTWGATLIEW